MINEDKKRREPLMVLFFASVFDVADEFGVISMGVESPDGGFLMAGPLLSGFSLSLPRAGNKVGILVIPIPPSLARGGGFDTIGGRKLFGLHLLIEVVLIAGARDSLINVAIEIMAPKVGLTTILIDVRRSLFQFRLKEPNVKNPIILENHDRANLVLKMPRGPSKNLSQIHIVIITTNLLKKVVVILKPIVGTNELFAETEEFLPSLERTILAHLATAISIQESEHISFPFHLYLYSIL